MTQFDWLEYLSLARGLYLRSQDSDTFSSAKQEAMIRAAISRAYYAAYNYSKVMLVPLSDSLYSLTGGSSHRRLWEYVAVQSGLPEISAAGKQLHRNRIKSDYEAVIRGRLSIVQLGEMSIKLAEQIVEEVNSAVG